MKTRLLPLRRKFRGGMLPEQFYLLEKGDVIRGSKSNVKHRIVESVHKSPDGRTTFVELLKLRPSWTRGPYTTYCCSDSYAFLPIRVQNEKIWEVTYESAMQKRKQAHEAYVAKKVAELKRRISELNKNI